MKWGVYMKISNNKIQKVLQMYSTQQVNTKNDKASKIGKRDELKLSAEAKDFQIAMEAIKKVPDIRKSKVDAIKSQVESGTYQVDSGKIVEKIFQDINIDERV